jgi:hypothetical protein
MLFSMEQKYSTKPSEVIKNSAFYFNSTWTANKKEFKQAYFYDNTGTIIKGSRVGFSDWNKEQQAKLDAMIDPTAPSIEIDAAEIRVDTKFGRRLFYFDKNGEWFKWTLENEAITNAHDYDGPIDIKKANDFYTIKPHRLLDKVQSVKEYDLWLPYPYTRSYLKKELTYNKNGTTTEKTTMHHRALQTAPIILGLGLAYAAYSCASKYFSK